MRTRPLARRDRETLLLIVREAGVFNEAEVKCAMELIDSCLGEEPSNDYHVQCAVDPGDIPMGYVCFGEVPLTEAVYDLYWIVVRREHRGSGVADALMEWLYGWLGERKARMVVAETSSTPLYEAARRFYRRQGFEPVAMIRDFYRVGDDKVVLVRRV